MGNFLLASVGSQAGGDNRKRARSAQRREGPMASSRAARDRGLILCVRYSPQMYVNQCNIHKKKSLNLGQFRRE
jgi:hypothetical protein